MKTTVAALALALAASAATAAGDAGRFAGTWEGIAHGGRGDQRVALVCRPRGAAVIAGTVYLDDVPLGPIEEGRARGDSLAFRAGGYLFRVSRNGETLSVDLVVPNGATHSFALRRTSADTTGAEQDARAANTPTLPQGRDTAPDSVFRAHFVPPGQVSSADASLRAGTLLLVGGGAGQADITARFLALAGGDSAHIVVIPTASMDSSDSAAAATRGARFAHVFGARDAAVMHTFSRRRADSEAFVAPLRDATGVWLSGGEGTLLLDSYLGTRTERDLVGVLARGGVVGGTSAGAIIWGSEMMTFRARPGAREYAQFALDDLMLDDVRESGFGLLRNVAVVPHFTEHHLEAFLTKLLAAHPGLLGIGIDEGTAIEVHGDLFAVLGRGHVTVFDGHDHGGFASLILDGGARYDLVRRTVL